MKLQEIIHYRPKDGARTAKALALRYLAGFVVIILLCTLLSRTASSLTMPQVIAEKPSRSAVAHVVRAEGIFHAGAETLVTATEGVLVDSISANAGRTVTAGDALFVLNADSLAKRIRTEALALQKLQIELSVQQQSSQLDDKHEQLAYDRAYQDYSNAFDRSYKTMDDARRARAEALNAMRSYYAQHKATIDKWIKENLPAGVSSLGESAIVARYYELQSAYEAADMVYEAARDSRSDSWKSAERSLEDAQLALDWNLNRQGEIMGLTLAMQEESLKELRRLAEDGGAIRSPIDGVVSQVLVQAGSATTQNAAAMVAQTDGGFRFVAEFTKDDLKYLTQGETATISMASGVPMKVTLDSIQNLTVTALPPQGKGELGARGVLEVTQKSDNYPTCVPMSALRSDGNQQYVMVLRETQTVLGTQLVAERVDVQLADNNETRAAVSGALLDSDRVIVSSSKPVRAGDRVRLAAP